MQELQNSLNVNAAAYFYNIPYKWGFGKCVLVELDFESQATLNIENTLLKI